MAKYQQSSALPAVKKNLYRFLSAIMTKNNVIMTIQKMMFVIL